MGLVGNLFNRLFGRKAKETKVSKLSTFSLFSPNFSDGAKAELNSTFVSAVNAHARTIGKIKPVAYCGDDPARRKGHLDRVLGLKPNRTMNASQFWRAVGRSYFMGNLVIIYPVWDPSSYREPLRELWPIDVSDGSVGVATAPDGRVAVRFYIGGTEYNEFAEDLIILQREPDARSLFGGRSPAINASIKAIQASYEGLEQAVKMSQYIRFIVQSSTTLSDANLKRRQEEIAERIFADGGNGIAYINSGENLREVTSNGKWPMAPEIETLKQDVYEYLGISANIVSGKYTEDEWQAYYESSIEPFCRELAQELTVKLFTEAEIARGNEIRVITDPLVTASLNTRIRIANAMMSLPVVVPNDIARLLYQPTYEGGDEPQANLNWVKANEQSAYQTGNEEDSNGGEPADDTSETQEEEGNGESGQA